MQSHKSGTLELWLELCRTGFSLGGKYDRGPEGGSMRTRPGGEEKVLGHHGSVRLANQSHRTQIRPLPGDWPQGGGSSRQFIPLGPGGVVSDTWPGTALSQSPGHFFPGSWLRWFLEGCPTCSLTWLSGKDPGEWGHCQCLGEDGGMTTVLRESSLVARTVKEAAPRLAR